MSAPLAVLDRIALMAVLTDANGSVAYINPPARDLANVSVGDQFSPIQRPDHMRVVKSISGATDRFTIAARVEGATRVIEWTTSPLPSGEILYTGQDVTRDRRSLNALRDMAKSATDASQSKMRFLATMSHEMRTPLNGILGMAGLLMDTDLSDNQQTYAEAVRESGQALLALINDILDYSKIEAGKVELEAQVFDIRTLVQSVAELLSPRAAQKGLEISSVIGTDVPLRVVGDEGRLRQVLLNLCSNGVKFTEKGGVLVRVELKSPTSAEDMVCLRFSVRDSGIGISAHDRERIFEEFGQADDTRTRNHEGTGLGLSIARQIVRAMGADFEVDSTIGVGSTFSFDINLPVRAAAPTISQDGMPSTILIASDQAFVRETLTLQLQECGIENILCAKTIDEAIAHLKRHRDATLLCDLKFAAEDGERIATLSANSIVLLSPVARGRLESFRRAGFDAYLIKPVRQISLHQRLRRENHVRSDLETRLDVTPPEKAHGATEKYRVLLAEDNPINTVLATAILKRAGHHVDVAANGREALEAFEHAAYDVVLMDMRMPEMDGLEATRSLRQRGYTDVPIIALTANAMGTDRDECQAAGMDDFLSKPFEPDDLLTTIQRLVSEKTLQAVPAETA